jgi:hypothetical protein
MFGELAECAVPEVSHEALAEKWYRSGTGLKDFYRSDNCRIRRVKKNVQLLMD